MAARQYEKVKSTAADAAHKVEETYEDAAKKARDEGHGDIHPSRMGLMGRA